MKTYSNHYIVEEVARHYDVRRLIIKMIDYSIKDRSCDDLAQYIYEYLLTYDNIRLNQMYNDKKLRPFISQIILRQRNGGVSNTNTEYINYLRIKDTNTFHFDTNYIEIDTYEYIIDMIIEYIDRRSELVEDKQYTSIELKYILAFTILKKYFLSELTQYKLAKHLNLSRSTITNLLKLAKEQIYKWWEDEGQYLDEKDYLKV